MTAEKIAEAVTTHTMQNVSAGNTETDVLWECTACGLSIGFNREGRGKPFASETKLPADLGSYLGECKKSLPPPAQVPIYIGKAAFMRAFSADEVAVIRESKDVRARYLWYLVELAPDNGIAVNNPETLDGLLYLESVGLLAQGRGLEAVTLLSIQ